MTNTTTQTADDRLAQHGIRAHSDGPVVPVQTRSERLRSYDLSDFPKVTGREVDWKFTPIEAMARTLTDEATDDREGDPAVAVSIPEAAGVEISARRVGEAPRGDAFTPEDIPSAIAWKQSPEALYIGIDAEAEIAEPVRVSLKGAGSDRRANAHIVIEAKHHARATVILEHTGSAQYAENVEIIVRDEAALTVVALQEWDDDAVHAGAHQAVVERNGFLKHVLITVGGSVVRINPSVHLAKEGADSEMYGLYFADAHQHLEQQVYVFHDAPNSRSRVNYKGALQGEGAHTVWIGDVLIGRRADGTDSYEQNRNLVLSDGTRADSIPNLEIETGNIEGAGHASATGRFDDEQLFYLTSRGINESQARRLVVRGFLHEIVQKIGVAEVEERLHEVLEEELRASETSIASEK